MILDCHVHVCAFTPEHGKTSAALLSGVSFKFMRWRFGLDGKFDGGTEKTLEDRLVKTIDEAELDAAVVLAFDAVYERDGTLNLDKTHLYVTNDYVIELAARHRKILFACSVHPYRNDAVAELERCVAAGAVMVKWLPITQDFNPADEKCIALYEAMAHHRIPLLSHTGWEHALPNLDKTVADPMLLQEALRRGVTVIAAHCGSRLFPWEIDFVPNWVRMAKDYEHFYGDTAALNVPNRWYAFDAILKDEAVRKKLVHGSDWPILAVPPPKKLGWDATLKLMGDENWMRRDIKIKKELGLDEGYWHRAGTLIRHPAVSGA